MYTPPLFREDRPEVMEALLREYPLATLVVMLGDGMEATHVPLLLRDGVLVGHVARGNPIAGADGVAAIAIFHGPQHYVSPGFYATKAQDPRVVPTWNYIAVHAHGTLRTFTEPSRLRTVVADLTAFFEGQRAEPWHIDDAPGAYIDKLLGAITGIEIPIVRWEGKWKVSQNRPLADRESVAEALADHPMGVAVKARS
jgi:transcriptional regulator